MIRNDGIVAYLHRNYYGKLLAKKNVQEMLLVLRGQNSRYQNDKPLSMILGYAELHKVTNA